MLFHDIFTADTSRCGPHVEDDELIRWEYPTLGTIATIQEVDYGQ